MRNISNYMAKESNLQIRVEVNCEEYWSVEAVDMDNISLGGHTGKNGTESSIVYFQFLNIEIIPWIK
jgi:hypothetical protein